MKEEVTVDVSNSTIEEIPAMDVAETTTQVVGNSFQIVTDLLQQSSDVLGEFLPQVVGAGLILVIGYFLAKILGWIVKNVMKKTGVDNKLNQLVGESDLATTASNITWYTVMTFVGLAILRTLGLDSISGPITELVNNFFEFIPQGVGALIILAVFCFIGKFLSMMLTNILQRVGFNEIAKGYLGETETDYSQLAGTATNGFVLFAGVAQAVETLGLSVLSSGVASIWEFGIPAMFGLIIITVGTALSGKISQFASAFLPDDVNFTQYLQYGIIAVSVIIGIRQTGLVDNLVDTVVPVVIGFAAAAVAYRYAVNGTLPNQD